ncbi:MAG: hypothetical protein ABSG54_10635 [Terriglobia bacterium]
MTKENGLCCVSIALSALLLISCGSSMTTTNNNGGGGNDGGAGNCSNATTGSSTDFSTSPVISGCPVFPTDNPWNTDISNFCVDPNSSAYINSINQDKQYLHADFGSNPDYGIPFVVVPGNQQFVAILFTEFPGESDPGPYPVSPDAPIEGGINSTGDRHVLTLDDGNCVLYELYHAYKDAGDPGWQAGSGAVFDLRSDALRHDGWTSADAAGLPILPGLARYDEVAAGAIQHALRFTVASTQHGYIHPATHFASPSSDPSLPPMGLRLRLKVSFDISGYTGQSKTILTALKKYGMIVADNGSSWYVTGAPDSRWDDTDLDQLKTVPGNAFEVVQTGAILH